MRTRLSNQLPRSVTTWTQVLKVICNPGFRVRARSHTRVGLLNYNFTLFNIITYSMKVCHAQHLTTYPPRSRSQLLLQRDQKPLHSEFHVRALSCTSVDQIQLNTILTHSMMVHHAQHLATNSHGQRSQL